MPATIHTTTFVDVLFTKMPIFALSFVNMISGITAKLSCMDNITWLSTNKPAIPFSPYNNVTKKAGTIAIARVMSRLIHGLSRIFKKPSITICPASVPVRVEF